MKKFNLILMLLIFNFSISCSEQDYYSVKSYPNIKIIDLDTSTAVFEIKTDTTRQIIITISNKENTKLEKNRISDIVKDTINIKKINFSNDYGIIYNNKISLGDFIYLNELSNLTTYYLTLYFINKDDIILHSKLKFNTVFPLPTEQSRNITFNNVTNNQMTVGWTPGNGLGRLVLIRKDTFPEFPTDGFDYKANNKYGDAKSKIGNNTYCIFNSTNKDENSVTVTNLNKGKYYFLVLEYNGEGFYRNYLKTTNTNNLRFKQTSIAAPIALEAEIIDDYNFVARWKKEQAVEYYLLDVAEDENFVNIIQPYENVDVGDSNLVEIQLPFSIKEKDVFYRLRAYSNGSITENSNVIKVRKK
jgi:hypothetical protein